MSNASMALDSGTSGSSSPDCVTTVATSGSDPPGPWRRASVMASRNGSAAASPCAPAAVATTARSGYSARPDAVRLGEAVHHDLRQQLRLLERPLRGHRGQRVGEMRETLEHVVFDELERRLLEPLPAALRGEPRGQLGEQRASVVVLPGVSQPLRQQERDLEVVGDHGPGARTARQMRSGSRPRPSCACTSSLAAGRVPSRPSARSAIAASGSHFFLSATLSPSCSRVCSPAPPRRSARTPRRAGSTRTTRRRAA